MVIKVTSDKPVRCQPYRVPLAKRDTVNTIVNELLQRGIIRHSTSPYAAPIVLVKKSNGEDRLCVDYRQLNAITVKQPFPMPIVEEQLALLAIYTSLDLIPGYYQISIEEESRKYTAFVTNDGHYEFNRMPFGLVNAPSVFQNAMNNLVNQLEPGQAIPYLDDIIIPGVNVTEGLERLGKFLTVLSTTGFTLRTSKCNFLTEQITFLGHIVNKDGISPGQRKIAAIKEFPPPSNIHELRRFLGLTGFFRKFIENFAEINRPLRPLLQTTGNVKFCWSAEHNCAFEALKSCLISKPILTLYDRNQQHEVHTDASATGIAGVLMQECDGKWKPVAYYSRHNNDAEQRYHSYELEVLAIVESLQRFRIYLLGKPLRVFTDCAAVSATKLSTPLQPKIARWWLKLQEFDFETVHRPAEKMAHADALSRQPHEPARDPEIVMQNIMRIEVSFDDWVATMQHQDRKLKEIIESLKSSTTNENKKLYKLVNNRLFWIQDPQPLWVVPSAIRWRILKHCHDDRGHFGIDKTVEAVRRNYWFVRLRDYTKKYIKNCIECCYNKRVPGKLEGILYIDEIEPVPFRTLNIDHLGPFIKSKCNIMVWM